MGRNVTRMRREARRRWRVSSGWNADLRLSFLNMIRLIGDRPSGTHAIEPRMNTDKHGYGLLVEESDASRLSSPRDVFSKDSSVLEMVLDLCPSVFIGGFLLNCYGYERFGVLTADFR